MSISGRRYFFYAINEDYSTAARIYNSLYSADATSNLAYKPQFISNNYKEGRKVLSSIEEELMACEEFSISVAFINMNGITPLLQILKELEVKGVPGRILTTDYQTFTEANEGKGMKFPKILRSYVTYVIPCIIIIIILMGLK